VNDPRQRLRRGWQKQEIAGRDAGGDRCGRRQDHADDGGAERAALREGSHARTIAAEGCESTSIRGVPETPATTILRSRGVSFHLHRYDYQPGGAYAAGVLGIPPARFAKTLVTSVDQQPLLVLVASNAVLSLKKLARARAGKHAVMMEPAAAQRLTGYQIGGISPIASRTPLAVLIDQALAAHETIAVNAGRRGLIVELSTGDLIALTGALISPLSAGDDRGPAPAGGATHR
jgi:Cys-tRNA(Pro)/Cys-tRNA(Cys) deacylase